MYCGRRFEFKVGRPLNTAVQISCAQLDFGTTRCALPCFLTAPQTSECNPRAAPASCVKNKPKTRVWGSPRRAPLPVGSERVRSPSLRRAVRRFSHSSQTLLLPSNLMNAQVSACLLYCSAVWPQPLLTSQLILSS